MSFMGNKYNTRCNHPQNLHQKRTYLPMLCSRHSIKEVHVPILEQPRCSSFSGDPLSPRIGCMGQVKQSNGIICLPTTTTASETAYLINQRNYSFKFKRFFSGKSLTTAGTTARRVSRRQGMGSGEDVGNEKGSNLISVVDLDPPLPVVKRVCKPEDATEVENLWRRRSGGVALQRLDIQEIHQQRLHLLRPIIVRTGNTMGGSA